jgi:hypothetical protein
MGVRNHQWLGVQSLWKQKHHPIDDFQGLHRDSCQIVDLLRQDKIQHQSQESNQQKLHLHLDAI